VKQRLRYRTLRITDGQILSVNNRHLVQHSHFKTAHVRILACRHSLLLKSLNVLVQESRSKFGKSIDKHIEFLKFIAQKVLDEGRRNVELLLVLLERAAVIEKGAFSGRELVSGVEIFGVDLMHGFFCHVGESEITERLHSV